MKTKKIILLLFLSSNIFAQDSTVTGNKWFAELQIANSGGWRTDLIHEANISVGGLYFKNIFFRINGGFYSGDATNNIFQISTINDDPLTLHRYTGGADLLYGIHVTRKIIFKTGLGYEYTFSKKDLTIIDNTPFPEHHERKDFANIYKLIESFNYNFTDNIYAFIQFHFAYERHHGSQKDRTILDETEYLDDFIYKENHLRLDNFILGGGINF